MNGMGVARGMWITFTHFVRTYSEDLRRFPRRYRSDKDAVQQKVSEQGVFSVQYPEERLRVFERARVFPVLVAEAATDELRCTACGICSKVCPPQCIWIVRAKGPDGRPKPNPEEFYIDVAICMSCGLCAEFCPFDAIKMDQRFEYAGYERVNSFVHDIKTLSVSSEYYAKTHPLAAAEEDEVRRKKAEAKAAR